MICFIFIAIYFCAFLLFCDRCMQIFVTAFFCDLCNFLCFCELLCVLYIMSLEKSTLKSVRGSKTAAARKLLAERRAKFQLEQRLFEIQQRLEEEQERRKHFKEKQELENRHRMEWEEIRNRQWMEKEERQLHERAKVLGEQQQIIEDDLVKKSLQLEDRTDDDSQTGNFNSHIVFKASSAMSVEVPNLAQHGQVRKFVSSGGGEWQPSAKQDDLQVQQLQVDLLAATMARVQDQAELPYNKPKFHVGDVAEFDSSLRLTYSQNGSLDGNPPSGHFPSNFTYGEAKDSENSYKDPVLEVTFDTTVQSLRGEFGKISKLTYHCSEKFEYCQEILSENGWYHQGLLFFSLESKNMMKKIHSLDCLNSIRELQVVMAKLPNNL